MKCMLYFAEKKQKHMKLDHLVSMKFNNQKGHNLLERKYFSGSMPLSHPNHRAGIKIIHVFYFRNYENVHFHMFCNIDVFA